MKKHKIAFFRLIILSIIFTGIIISINIQGFGKDNKNTVKSITPEEATNKVTNIINKYFSKGSDTLPPGKATEESGIYGVEFNIDGNFQKFYLTKDGAILIFPNGSIDIAKFEETAKKQQEPQTEEIPKTERPIVELFVMSLCPYGVKAEKEIFPVINSYGDKIDFKIKFIASVKGNSIDGASSLHGNAEAREDVRQAAIMKYYPDKLLPYIEKIDEKSCLVSCGAVKLEEYWRQAAKQLHMDVKKIETFAYGQEGINLLKENETDAKKYEVNASPTLVINGKKSSAIYRGRKTIEETINSAFINPPDKGK